MKWRIGCSGFYYKDWKNTFYPPDLPQSKWFSFYCDHFNTLELNVTFYRFPRVEYLKSWFKKSPSEFNFAVKAPRLITHYKKFNDSKSLLDDFYSVIDKGLKNKLGCVLFQLPASVIYSDETLELLVKNINLSFINVIEFRHKSWWNKKVYEVLAKNKISFCSISHPDLPRTIILNTPLAYIRMHGVPALYSSQYSVQTLKNIYNKVRKTKKISEAYMYFNNTANSTAIINVKEMQRIVS